MNLKSFKDILQSDASKIAFTDTLDVIEANYDFSPTAFRNGETMNQAGNNSGSCKVFAFAILEGLSKEETLACFGTYYRRDVLANPEGDDHQNIRNFIKTGFEGIEFEGVALTRKS